jgi:hypothetical protein
LDSNTLGFDAAQLLLCIHTISQIYTCALLQHWRAAKSAAATRYGISSQHDGVIWVYFMYEWPEQTAVAA